MSIAIVYKIYILIPYLSLAMNAAETKRNVLEWGFHLIYIQILHDLFTYFDSKNRKVCILVIARNKKIINDSLL